MTAPILSARGVHVTFGGVRAADDVALDIFPGEFLATFRSTAATSPGSPRAPSRASASRARSSIRSCSPTRA
jgi:hypothetical protein